MCIQFNLLHYHVVCQAVTNPLNGKVTITGQDIGARAEYSCVSWYMLVGQGVRQCQENGQWSGDPPQCGNH